MFNRKVLSLSSVVKTSPIRILLVEDDKVIADDRAQRLTKDGYEVTAVIDGENALKLIKESQQFELVLMDIGLGDGPDGTQVAKQILEKRDIPIIFLTAYTEAETLAKVKDITHYGYVLKSYGYPLIKSSIEMALNLFAAKKAEAETSLLLQSVMESSPQNIFAKHRDGQFLVVNQRFCVTEGKTPDEIIGKYDSDLHPEPIAEGYRKDDLEVIKTGKTIEYEEIHHPIGKPPFAVQVIKTPLYDARGQIYGVLGIFWDITERKLAEEQKKIQEEERFNQLTIEPLTGFPNEYLLNKDITERLQRPQAPFYLARLHISNFGKVGSIYGRTVADEYLQQRSVQLKQLVEDILPGSRVFRSINMAGFDILLPTDNPELVKKMAVLLQKLFMSPLKTVNSEILNAIFVGACSSELVKNSQELLDNCDLTIQAVKGSKNLELQFYDKKLLLGLQNAEIYKINAAKALAEKEIKPWFQPQISMTGEIAAYEVLSRWITPEGKIIMPDAFKDTFASLGLMGVWFESLLEQVCDYLLVSQDYNIKYSLNVAPVQFSDPDFVARTIAILQRKGVNPKRIKLEILEGEDVLANQNIVATLLLLDEQGVSLAIDDYGEGYHSLINTIRLIEDGKVSTLKIAREVISQILVSPRSYKSVAHIFDMVSDLTVDIVAEGVETIEQLKALHDLSTKAGCGVRLLIQGYYFNKPGPPEDILNVSPDVYKKLIPWLGEKGNSEIV